MQPGEEFLGGFLSAINKNQERRMQNNELTPENKMNLLQMESQGQIKKHPFADNPQGAIQHITKLLMGGHDPMSQYQAVPLEEQLKTQNVGQRRPYFTVLGFDEKNNVPVQQNAADGKFFAGTKEISADEVGRLLSKTKPNISGETAEFFSKAKTLASVMQDIDKTYKDSYVGPIAGRAGRVVDLYTPFGNEERSRFRNQVAKAFNTLVYLRSGKAINQEEANRLAEEFMGINNTPIAFRAGYSAMKDELNNLVESRQSAMQKAGFGNADEFQGFGRISGQQSTQPTAEPSLSTPDGVKAAYKAGKLSREQAKALIQAINKGAK